MTDIHLYHLPGACSRVTLTALELTGAAFEVTVPAMHRGALNSQPYRALNPLGQVPTLTLGSVSITENVAILLTLAQLFPSAALLPLGGAVETGRAVSRLAICSTQLHPCVTRIMFPERFCDESPAATNRVREQAIAMLLARLAALEPAFVEQPFWLGESYSIADSYLLWITGRMIGMALDFSGLPALTAHAERVRALPVSQRVLAREATFLELLEADGAVFPAHVRPSMTT